MPPENIKKGDVFHHSNDVAYYNKKVLAVYDGNVLLSVAWVHRDKTKQIENEILADGWYTIAELEKEGSFKEEQN